MQKLTALKNFQGAPGESQHPDRMVRRNSSFTPATKSRADELIRLGIAEIFDGEKAKTDRPNKKKPKPSNKGGRRPLSEAERVARARKAAATRAAKSAGQTGAVNAQSLSEAGHQPEPSGNGLPGSAAPVS